ncbi:MAG: glycosyltransferase WbuB, partial [Alphaproteobacteria bacterium]
MRILHIFDHSLPVQTGYSFRSRAILAEQQARGLVTAHVTSPKHAGANGGEETVDGLSFQRTPKPTGLAARLPGFGELAMVAATARRVGEVADGFKPDILHAHSPVLNAMAAVRAASRRGLPVVYEIRAFWEDAAASHGTCREGDGRYRLTRFLETRAARRVDAITVICDGLRRDLIARGIAAAKITVIPNAVDT